MTPDDIKPPATQVAPTPVINITLAALRSLMWEFEHLAGVTSQSYIRGDTYAPKICPLEFYEIVRHADPTASVFHIALYSDHCEVWHRQHWERSLSKRHAAIAASDARDAARIATRASISNNDTLRKQVYNELLLLLPTVPVETLWTFAGALMTTPITFFETNNFPTIKTLLYPPNKPTALIPVEVESIRSAETAATDDTDLDTSNEPIYQ